MVTSKRQASAANEDAHAKAAAQGRRLLSRLTTASIVGIVSNMKASLLARNRIVYSENSFAELVLWKVPAPLLGSAHGFKCRLAYVVGGLCVVRYDNEVGKGDHRHFGDFESR